MKSILTFIILCHFFMLTLCQKRSLVFVFDTTGSMGDDLVYFKEGANMILDAAALNHNSPYHDYVLVPFNDPGFGPATVTQDEDYFRELMQNITVGHGGDCPEMCFSGIKLALEKSLHYSDIYVMTDATEKDSRLLQDLINLIQRKKSHIWFLLRGDCGANTVNNYVTVAEASSGQVFYLSTSSDILDVLEYVNKTVNENRVEMVYIVNTAAYDKTYDIMVDKSMTSISIIVSGGKPKIEVLNPNGDLVTDASIIENTLNLTKIQAVDVKVLTEGKWTIRYGSNDKHTLKVTAVSTVKLQYGFSTRNATTIGEATNWPLKGQKNSVLVAVTGGKDQVKLLTHVEIVNSSGSILFNLSLSRLARSNDDFTYSTEPFTPPTVLFYVITNGGDMSGNEMRRTSNTAIQVQEPDKPYITMEEQVTVKKREKLTLNCQVDSLIPITVNWTKDSEYLNEPLSFEQSGEAKYVINSVDFSDEGLYDCLAFNSKGTDTKFINVTVTSYGNSLHPQFNVVYFFAVMVYFSKLFSQNYKIII